MEQIYTLRKPESHRDRKRVGRGTASGHGKTSCRGQKGQMSRSGARSKPGYEGGQMPLQRRVPKRGFNNIFKEEYQVINIEQLAALDAAEISVDVLKKKGLIKKSNVKVKVLGTGEIAKSIKVTADAFSAAAKEKIEKAGGSVVIQSLKANTEEL